jgi:hypothetical protein
MRGILMALFAFDFPGHRSGGSHARLFSTKTTAKKATTTTV